MKYPKSSTPANSRRWTIEQGDVLTKLRAIPDNTFDAVLTDPPYGLKLMGHKWDAGVPSVEVWKEVLRVCKPGAFLLAFGGTRTSHRLTCNIEDAGWEIRDSILWLYGQGFPKSQDISKAIDRKLGGKRRVVGYRPNVHRGTSADHRYGYAAPGKQIPITLPVTEQAVQWHGYGTALKPGHEPIIVAVKPRQGSFASNAIEWGCGGLNIDACRIGTTGGTKRSHQAPYPKTADGKEDRTQWARSGHVSISISEGRWPANVILDEEAAALLDRQTGISKSRRSRRRKTASNVGNGRTLHPYKSRIEAIEGYEDEGGASRFFFCPKVSKAERQACTHPTMKPLRLCQYLATLLLPPAGTTPRKLLLPYCGCGSEMIGALQAGWDHLMGIELDPKYVAQAKRRLSRFSKAA